MESGELFNSDFCQQSEFVDWNRVLQQTYLLSHSSDTNILCHVLKNVEDLKLGHQPDLNSQISVSSILNVKKIKTSKNKGKSIPENIDIKIKNKTEKEEKHGMDIRGFMALPSDKAQLTQVTQKENILSQQENVIQPIIQSPIQLSPNAQNKVIVFEETKEEICNELNCLFCKNGIDVHKKQCSVFVFDSLTQVSMDQLSSVENIVNNLTKENILNINILDNFCSIKDFTLNNIKQSITVLEEELQLSSIKEIQVDEFIDVNSIFDSNSPTSPELKNVMSNNLCSKKTPSSAEENNKLLSPESDVFDVNDIFENDFYTPVKNVSPQKPVSSNNVCEIKNKLLCNTSNDLKTTKQNHSPEQNYFNLEDIFNDENNDLKFSSFVNNTQTSTPITEKKFTFTETSKDMFIETVQSNKKDLNCENVSGNKRNLLEVHDDLIENKKLKAVSRKNVFKIPQIKLKSETMISPTKVSDNYDKYNKILSPESPILSSQVSTQKSVNYDVTSKQKCRELFKNDEFCKNGGDSSFTIERLESSESDNCTEKEEHILSASQLFDDESSDENKIEDLEQSSMYTITQMVSKVSAMAKQTNSPKPTSNEMKTENGTSALVEWGSSDEDNLFINIDLNNLPLEKGVSSGLSKGQKHLCKINQRENCGEIVLRNVLNHESKKEKSTTHFPSNNDSEVLTCKNLMHISDTISMTLCDDKTNKYLRTTPDREEPQPNSSWLSCTKEPLHLRKVNTTVLYSQTNNFTDSDSNSDVFLSPLPKSKHKIDKKSEKISEKENAKRAYFELEAEVSGFACSSDEENTSGLDDLDESFINDLTELPNNSLDQTKLDMQAQYLQSVRSPLRKPGGYKIPNLSPVNNVDVFSQVDENDESYLNDSFCCDTTEIPVNEDLSILEIAEQNLEQNKKWKRKRTKRKMLVGSRSNSKEQKNLKRKRLLISESSSEEEIIEKNRNNRFKSLSSSSSDTSQKIKGRSKIRKKVHLLTSDSDSDKTI